MAPNFLNQLEDLLQERKTHLPPNSYTTTLFSGGTDRILKKVGEEAGEVIIAAKNNDLDELKNESADLLFHLMVTLVDKGVSLADVIDILKSRHHNTKS
jgi:phosphoribosyl-ATP pyrophosphohydrolase